MSAVLTVAGVWAVLGFWSWIAYTRERRATLPPRSPDGLVDLNAERALRTQRAIEGRS